MIRFWAEHAWLGTGLALNVLIEVDGDRFSAVTANVPPPPSAQRLPGLVLPGFANTHSHAFHRALRGRTQRGAGTFWSWRDQMFRAASLLQPDSYFVLARAVYAEMALAGVSTVGEFHYLHHAPGGTPYSDPNAMSAALVAAVQEAGIRITLLDTVYVTSTVDGAPLAGVQLRFGDGDAARWAARMDSFKPETADARVGAAIHSVRAVPASQLPNVASWADGRPLHVHLSEQRAENEACFAHYGRSPTQLLSDTGVLGPQATAVHATHLSPSDIVLLGGSGTNVCFCPTTERDLADGIGPAAALRDAGSPLCLGSDSHAVVDPFEEARALELNERLRSETRGHFDPDALLHAACGAGHAALGWPDAGTIAPGQWADLVAVRLDTVRTAGYAPEYVAAAVVFGAVAADVHTVVVSGRTIVDNGRHLSMDVPRALDEAIGAVWR